MVWNDLAGGETWVVVSSAVVVVSVIGRARAKAVINTMRMGSGLSTTLLGTTSDLMGVMVPLIFEIGVEFTRLSITTGV